MKYTIRWSTVLSGEEYSNSSKEVQKFIDTFPNIDGKKRNGIYTLKADFNATFEAKNLEEAKQITNQYYDVDFFTLEDEKGNIVLTEKDDLSVDESLI